MGVQFDLTWSGGVSAPQRRQSQRESMHRDSQISDSHPQRIPALPPASPYFATDTCADGHISMRMSYESPNTSSLKSSDSSNARTEPKECVRALTHSKQYTKPPFGPYSSSLMTSSRLIRSRMSITGVTSSVDDGRAAGSKLTRCAVRLDTRRWLMKAVEKVDFPAPAGPVTSTA
jgi:hypothetical protein